MEGSAVRMKDLRTTNASSSLVSLSLTCLTDEGILLTYHPVESLDMPAPSYSFRGISIGQYVLC
jgi:hypothetical protein